jgi:peptidoglycan-associated lipoprotein
MHISPSLKTRIILILILFAVLSGCAVNRKVPPPSDDESMWLDPPKADTNTTTKNISKANITTIEKAQPVPPKNDPNISEESLSANEISIEQGVPMEDQKPLNLDDIYFDFDRADLSMDARERLEGIATWMEAQQSIRLRIEGHADERGTSEYNLALGDRRANAVKKYLRALGIEGNRLRAISYGEEMPAELIQTESGWAKNRRVHFEQN